jgi:hypothetical protein
MALTIICAYGMSECLRNHNYLDSTDGEHQTISPTKHGGFAQYMLAVSREIFYFFFKGSQTFAPHLHRQSGNIIGSQLALTSNLEKNYSRYLNEIRSKRHSHLSNLIAIRILRFRSVALLTYASVLMTIPVAIKGPATSANENPS